MLQGNNHKALRLATHGFLIGVEVEEGTSIDHLMSRLIDSLAFIEGVGRVEAEHLGEMGAYTDLEEQVLDSIVTGEAPSKES